MHGEQVDETQDISLGHEVAYDVEHRAPPAEPRRILDLARRRGPRHPCHGRSAEHLRRQQLAQRLRAVEHACRVAAVDLHGLRSDGHSVSLSRESLDDGQPYDIGLALSLVQREPGRGTKCATQPLSDSLELRVRREHGVLGECELTRSGRVRGRTRQQHGISRREVCDS